MQTPIKLLSFDLDDTLWPCLPTIMAAEKAHYRWMQQHVPVICLHYTITQLAEKRRALMAANPQWAHDLSRVRMESLRSLSLEFGLDFNWVQPAFNVFYRARQQVKMFDDVAPALDKLAQHYRLIALTNGNSDMQKTGIQPWFEFALSAADAGEKKSKPAIYAMAMARAGVSASQCVHIGNDPEQDVLGAQRAGIYSIWLNRTDIVWTQTDYWPDAQIGSLYELPDLLLSFCHV